MKIEKIYFDLDGVLADFRRGVRDLCGMDPFRRTKKTATGDDAMWEAIKKVAHFYDRLEPMPGALELFNTLYERYGDACEILSGIPKPQRGVLTSGEDKTRWAHRLLNEHVIVNTVFRGGKKDYAKGPGHILIDDWRKNIREWEVHGGTGILYISAEDVLEKIGKIEKE